MTREITTLLEKVGKMEAFNSVRYGSDEYIGLDLKNMDILSGIVKVKTYRGDIFTIRIEKNFDNMKKEPFYNVVRVGDPKDKHRDEFRLFTFYKPFDIAAIPLYGRYVDERDEKLMDCLVTNKIGQNSKSFVDLNIDELKESHTEYFV